MYLKAGGLEEGTVKSRHPWKNSNMLLLAILLLGVGIQAAPQYFGYKVLKTPSLPQLF